MIRPPAVILAGGQSRRMGQNKALIQLGSKPLVAHVADRLRDQCATLAINAPLPIGDLPHLPDPIAGQPGPIAGVLAAMLWAAQTGHDHVVTVPVDTPFLPLDLIERLSKAGPRSIAHSSRAHPVIGYWPVSMAPELRDALGRDERRIGSLTEGFAPVRWGDQPDPFFNVNTPEDLAKAHARL